MKRLELTPEQKEQFNDLLEEIGNELDISETQYNQAVASYKAIGTLLSKEDSLLYPYSPEIIPQGSFMLNTVIKPISDKDDLDVDLVCQLKGKKLEWTQEDLKTIVGDQLKSSKIYQNLPLKNGRRCWTLSYRDNAENPKERYHMDILPSIVDDGYRIVLEKAFSSMDIGDLDSLAIRITDKERKDYNSENDHKIWLKSNPFGYGKWFFERARTERRELKFLSESIQPLPKYQKEKLPLQRVVQILKRHRDMMFDGDEHKPISIIITTLAAKAYNRETDVLEALFNIVSKMEDGINEYNPHTLEKMNWIENPVNSEENFADKWVKEPIKRDNFFKWLEQVKTDIYTALGKNDLQFIMESMEKPLGKDLVRKAFSNYGNNMLTKRENNLLKMASGTGMIGSTGRTNIPQHKPYGKSEK